MSDVVMDTASDHVTVSFMVAECFTGEMKAAIENGIRTTFTFFVDLLEERKFWWNKGITRVKASHEIHYDTVKKVYTISLSERGDQPILVYDFDKAKDVMSRISDLKVAEIENLEKGKRYQIRMMAELDKITLPFYLHYIFFFLSLWDFKTDWYTVDFHL